MHVFYQCQDRQTNRQRQTGRQTDRDRTYGHTMPATNLFHVISTPWHKHDSTWVRLWHDIFVHQIATFHTQLDTRQTLLVSCLWNVEWGSHLDRWRLAAEDDCDSEAAAELGLVIISLLIWNTDDDAHHSYCVYYVQKQMKEMITSCYTHVHKQIMPTKTKFIVTLIPVCNMKLSFHCHHLKDSCECNVIKMGSDETHINVSLKYEEQRHKTVSTDHNFLTDRTAKMDWTEVFLLTSLMH